MSKKKPKAPPPPPEAPPDVFDGTKTFTVHDADIAFPTRQPWFTPYDRIPEQHKRLDSPWARLWGRMFNGERKSKDLRLYPREGVNDGNVHSVAAARMVAVVSGCWDIKHEHKEALIAYIYDTFFELGWFTGEEPPEILALLELEKARTDQG